MSQPTPDIVKTVAGHVITATLAALVTFFVAIGSYREKIDALTIEGAKTQVSVIQLSTSVNDLRLEMVEIKTEMRLSRKN